MKDSSGVTSSEGSTLSSWDSVKKILSVTQAMAAETRYESLMDLFVRASLNISGARRVLLMVRYGNRITLEAEGALSEAGTGGDIDTSVHAVSPPVIPYPENTSFMGMPLHMLMKLLEESSDILQCGSAGTPSDPEAGIDRPETATLLFIRTRFRKKETIGCFEYPAGHGAISEDITGMLLPVFMQGAVSIENALTCTRREEMVRKYHELCEISDRILREFEISHYENLQRRMNPHFLFNALNTIHSLINTDPDRARTAIEMLADIFHFITEKSFMSLTPFDDEWGFTANYLEFEKLRFPETFSFEMERAGTFEGISIPPLTIQPLVENAIKHGLRKKRDSGHITIEARRKGDLLTISVADNGTRLRRKKIFDGTLGNIRDRLKYHFSEADLTLKSRRAGGVTAVIRLTLPAAQEQQS